MTLDPLTRAVFAVMQDAAQRAIMPRFRALAAEDIVSKAPDDVVTIADQEAEAILAEGLAKIRPGATIVGEEAAHADPALLDRLGDDMCWIVDPLDGTNNFAVGKVPFGIMVALSEGGDTVAGWIYDPIAGRLCHAVRGGGAFIMGERVQARGSGKAKPVAAISLVFMDPARREAVKGAVVLHYEVVDIPRCAAEQYPRIVLGMNDVAVFERTLAWDHAAGVLFVNEAGGKAARPDGRPYRVDQAGLPGLIGAASARLWDDLAARLDGL